MLFTSVSISSSILLTPEASLSNGSFESLVGSRSRKSPAMIRCTRPFTSLTRR